MADSNTKRNPFLTQFRSSLDKREVIPGKKQQLETFRDRCEQGSEDRRLADEMLAECERLGDAEISRVYFEMIERRNRPKAGARQRNGGRRPRPGRRGQGPRDGRGGTARGDHRYSSGPGGSSGRGQPTAQGNAGAGEPVHLGASFHNPYTFIPFPPSDWFSGRRTRRRPTLLTIDEKEDDRFTGIIHIEIETCSPLMTCDPTGKENREGHQTYRALTSGNDVIVSATGVRGSLRTLLTILAGGTLSYLDETTWLVQGRDLPLGPPSHANQDVPRQVFLARVVTPGAVGREGTLELGRTRLYKADALERLCESRRAGIGVVPRPESGDEITHLWVNDAVNSVSKVKDGEHCWQVKFSGRPINRQGKREGLFLGSGKKIQVPSELWMAYQGRHRHSDHPQLGVGDLVWIEAKSKDATSVSSVDEIASLQWARWGRRGERLLDIVEHRHAHMMPDSLDDEGLVDEVTDLFGQAPMEGQRGPAGPFAARVRPDNLVFIDAKSRVKRHTLAPLAPPHPGCAAFYRDTDEPDRVTNDGLPLRGYKVYRNTTERGAKAPWLFSAQGVYGDRGELKSNKQRVNKTCDLLAEGCRGTLRLACRGLSKRELSLVLLACSVDWRLGGGKPLGLGHCRPVKTTVYDEGYEPVFEMSRDGLEPATLPDDYVQEVQDLLPRRDLWHASQLPVEHLRYPRAVSENRKRKQRGGHVWFQRHANPKKGLKTDRVARGLEVMWVMDDLEKKVEANRIRAQVLPRLSAEDPRGDVLHGHDLFVGEGDAWVEKRKNRQTFHKKIEPFNPRAHARSEDASGGPAGQTGQTRRDQRRRDRGSGGRDR